MKYFFVALFLLPFVSCKKDKKEELPPFFEEISHNADRVNVFIKCESCETKNINQLNNTSSVQEWGYYTKYINPQGGTASVDGEIKSKVDGEVKIIVYYWKKKEWEKSKILKAGETFVYTGSVSR